MRTPDHGSADRPRAVEVLNISPNSENLVLWLGGYRGILTHFNRGASTPCPGVAACSSHGRAGRIVYKAYAPALKWSIREGAWLYAVPEITEALEEALRGRVLRGELWSLSRPQEGKRPAPVLGVYLETKEENTLPDPFDVVPVITRLYRTNAIAWDVANPIDDRLCMPAVPLPPPLVKELGAMTGHFEEEQKAAAVEKNRLKSIANEFTRRFPPRVNGTASKP